MPLMSLTEAAEYLGMSRQSVHLAITEGRLPAQRVGRQWVIRREDVESYSPRPYDGKRANVRPPDLPEENGE